MKLKAERRQGERKGMGREEVRQRRQVQEIEKRQKQQEKQSLEASLHPKARANKRSPKSTKHRLSST